MGTNQTMNDLIRGQKPQAERATRRSQREEKPPREEKEQEPQEREDLEVEELYELVSVALKRADEAMVELARRSVDDSASADVTRQTKELKEVE